MKIIDLFDSSSPVFSFEFFPPKTDQGFKKLSETIQELKKLQPGYVSVTWGAGGSTRRKTIELVSQIQNEIEMTAMAHLTCIGATQEEIAHSLDHLQENGIENILALAGDRPEGYQPPQDGFTYASELVSFIRTRWNLCLAGACYPEVHPAANSAEEDLEHLRHKVECGVDFLITQLFFDNQAYFQFVERARDAGIQVPIVPGIMPVVSAENVRRMTNLCGTSIPKALNQKLQSCEDDREKTLETGIEWATRQCEELLAQGAPGIHFYTLNQSPATRRIYENLFPR